MCSGIFFKIIKNAFLQRRKTVINALNNNLNLPKDALMNIFKKLDISLTSRAENLNLEQFAGLANELIKNKLM